MQHTQNRSEKSEIEVLIIVDEFYQ